MQVLWTTLLLGCGGATAASTSSGTSINPSYIDFGTQAVSTTKTGSVTISSTRKAQIQGVTVSGSSTFKITNWSGRTSIPAGGSVTLNVSFTPTSASNYTGVMSVSMNGSKFSVPLSGSGQSTSSPTPAPTISVSVSPTSAMVQATQSQQFSASVSGSTNSQVSWLVNGIAGGNSTVGTISASGLYTAPATVPSGGTATVTAQSAADTSKSASANVTIAAAPAPVSVSVSPTNATVQASKSQQFSASVSGSTNTQVSWLVNGIAGGNSTVGTVNASGLYTAPATVPSGGGATVTAKSAADTSKSASADVTITAAPATVSVSVSPTSATVAGGSTVQYSATVSGTTNTSVTWEVNGVAGGNSTVGTISSNGLYSAPVVNSDTNFTITARSYYDSTKYANATASVTASSGNHLYVSTTGSDSNNCSSSAPCRTIGRASQVAIPGTTVHVAAGTYNGNITTSTSGTSSSRIRYVSDTKWGAKLVGSGSGIIWQLNASYVDIVGFDITGANSLGIYIGWSGTGQVGYNRILNNNIHDLTASGGCDSTGGAAIDTGQGTSLGHNWVIGNRVANIGASMIGSCNTIQGIYISTANDLVANNIVSGVALGGIQQWHGATASTIVNNTVFHCYVGIVMGDGDGGALAGGSANNFVANNIVVNNQYGIDEIGRMGSGNSYVDNLVFNNPTNLKISSASASGTVIADPQFVSYKADGSGNYHLAAGSPAIDKGTSTNAPSTDYDGASRTGVIDIGAYEYQY